MFGLGLGLGLGLELGLGGNCPRTIQADRAFWSFQTLIKMRNKNEVSYIIIFTWFSSTCTTIWNTFKTVLAARANWCWISCFQPYTCILQTVVDEMVRDQGLSWLVPGSFHWVSNPTPMDHNLFLPLIVYKLLDYHNKQLSELVATSQSIAFGCHKQLYLNSFKVA